MKLTKQVEEARSHLEESIEQMDDQDAKIQALPDDTPEEEREFHSALFNRYQEDVKRRKETLERLIAIGKAREGVPGADENEETEERRKPLSVNEPLTYRDRGPHSFFGDMVRAKFQDDAEAAERIHRHSDEMRVEKRDVTAASGAANLLPPVYLGERWINEEMEGRPLANAVASMPLPAFGSSVDIPRVATAPEVAVQASEAAAVNEVDFDDELYTVSKVTIAGQNDVSVQAFDWTSPGLDDVIMRELVRDYNRKLDTQLLSGSGASGQHEGLRNVTGINEVAFASGGADDLLGAIYEAQSDISTNAPGYMGNALVMHPRRAAWVASHRDANANLLQQGELVWAAGRQDVGFAGSIAGIGVLLDGNIATNLGSGTNEDEVFLVNLDEIILSEGELRARVLSEVLSGTLQVRIQLYSYSAFFGGRRPLTIAHIGGAGLATPTFPST